MAYIDRATRQEVEAYAKVVVLAASCCETAKIMLQLQVAPLAHRHRQFQRTIGSQSGGSSLRALRRTDACRSWSVSPPIPIMSHDSTVVWHAALAESEESL